MTNVTGALNFVLENLKGGRRVLGSDPYITSV